MRLIIQGLLETAVVETGQRLIPSGLISSEKGQVMDRQDIDERNSIAFDAKEFLAKVGEGKSILNYRSGQTIFSQGDFAGVIKDAFEPCWLVITRTK